MTTPNRIVLKSANRHDEGVAAAALYPGHVVEKTSASTSPATVQKQTSYGKTGERLIAVEDALQGKTTTQAFATGDIVPLLMADPGDLALLRLPAAAAAVTKGDKLLLNGDGCVVKAAGLARPYYANVAVSAGAGTGVNTITAFDKTFTFPANFLKAGDTVRIRAAVKFTATHSTDTAVLTLKIGTTTIIATTAVDVADNDVGFIDILLTVLTVGATGTFAVSGSWSVGVPGTATAKPFYLVPTVIDTTAAQTITPYVTFSVADAGNAAVLEQLTAEVGRVEEVFAYAEESVDNSAGEAETFIRARIQ